ncbi:hypothetical protein D9M71_252420 [compost metagenome]
MGGAVLFFFAQQLQHTGFVVGGRIVEQHLHQEAVHLCFGQGVGAFLLDGVLGGDDHEQVRQFVAVAGHGDLPLFHGFEQCCLDLGRGPVDFIGQNQVAEQRPGLELHLVLAVDLLQHFGTRDVRRQQVGGELDTAHLRVQVPGQRLDRAGLGQARQAFEQQVTVGQQAEHDLPDDGLLAKYGFGDIGLQGVDSVAVPTHYNFLLGAYSATGVSTGNCQRPSRTFWSGKYMRSTP